MLATSSSLYELKVCLEFDIATMIAKLHSLLLLNGFLTDFLVCADIKKLKTLSKSKFFFLVGGYYVATIMNVVGDYEVCP